MAVHTSKVTTQSNADLQLDPNGTGVVQLNKLTGGGASQPVGVDDTGKTKKFLPGDTAARGTAAGSDIVMVQASGASTVTQTTITALVAAGGGGGEWTVSGSNLFPTTLTHNVGIKKNNPAYALDVNGDLASTNFRIDLLTELT